jgi:hypothetical protein
MVEISSGCEYTGGECSLGRKTEGKLNVWNWFEIHQEFRNQTKN